MRELFIYLSPAYFLFFVALLVFYARKCTKPQPAKTYFTIFTISMIVASLEITISDFDPSKAGYPLPAIFLLMLACSCVERLYKMAKVNETASPKLQ